MFLIKASHVVNKNSFQSNRHVVDECVIVSGVLG